MLRIFQKLFPLNSFLISNHSIFSTANLYTININDQYFFVEVISSSFTSIQETQKILTNSLNELFTPINCTILITKDITIDNFISQKIQISLYNSQNYHSILLFPLDFLIFLANHLGYTYFYNTNSLHEFHKELYTIKPNLIIPHLWFELSEKEIQDIFYYLIINNLATPKMLALFFKKIPLKNISNYFSKRIAEEINYELTLLSHTENNQLLNIIYYIIENNIIKYLNINPSSISVLKNQQKLFQYYKYYFLEYSVPHLELTDFSFFNKSINTSFFNLLLSKLPYNSIISFFKFSPQNNQNILNIILSKHKKNQIQQNINENIDLISSELFIDFLSQLAAHFSYKEFEDYINIYLTNPRNWEFIAQEIDLRDLLICIDSLHDKNKKYLPSILQRLYSLYCKGIIIFPNMQNRSLIQAQKNYITAIYKLVLLKLL